MEWEDKCILYPRKDRTSYVSQAKQNKTKKPFRDYLRFK